MHFKLTVAIETTILKWLKQYLKDNLWLKHKMFKTVIKKLFSLFEINKIAHLLSTSNTIVSKDITWRLKNIYWMTAP